MMTERDHAFISWVVRSFLNWSLKNTDAISDAVVSSDEKNVFNVIVHNRNDRIVDYILKHPSQNIAIVYGALHFNGVYEALQRTDSTWHTIQVTTYTPYNQ